MPLSIGDPAPDVELPDDDGDDVRLSSLWRHRPLLLFFLRHYG
ncbi:MAG: redoxin domain-containing protein [Planctomycetes bacterium]|nr:redoxin domain-containing protein [Planctomycetota bacterium]